MASAGSSFSDHWLFSEPVLVDGSMTPPPSSSLPGTRCYMVKCWTRGASTQVYHGLGPSPKIAKKAAQLNAETRMSATSSSTRQQQQLAKFVPETQKTINQSAGVFVQLPLHPLEVTFKYNIPLELVSTNQLPWSEQELLQQLSSHKDDSESTEDSQSDSSEDLEEFDWGAAGSNFSDCYVSSDFIMTKTGSCCLPTELEMPVLRQK